MSYTPNFSTQTVSLLNPGQYGLITASISGNTAGTPVAISAGNIILAGGSNITLSQSGSSISIVGGAGGGAGDGYNILAAGTQTANTTGTVKFADSNGITFGMSNSSQITASYTVPTQSVQTQNMVSVLGSTGNISFNNGNGITFGGNNSTITASHNGLTSQSNQAYSAGNGSAAFQTLSFADSNGVSFSTGTQGVYATVQTNYLTTARASTDAIGLNTAQSNVTWTANSSGLSLDARGYAGTNTTFNGANISGSITQNSNGLNLSLSVAPGGGGADGYNILAAGTQTAATNTSVKFADSNGISFGMSASSQITASYTVPSIAGLISAINVSGGTTSNNLSKITFADSNGISFGLNGSTLTATVKTDYQSSNANYLTSQSNQAISGSNGSFTFQTVTFGNSNGLSFYSTNGSMVGSHNALTTARASTDAIGLNTAQSNVTWTANSSGLSLDARGYAGTGTSATNASITLNSNGLAISVGAGGGGVTPVASASNGSFSFTTLNFSNANNVTFGTSAGSIITASVAAPGAAAENNWFNLLGNNTAGNTTASGSTIGLSGGNNITLSGTNGSVIRIDAGVPIKTAASTFVPGSQDYAPGGQFSSSSLGQNSLYLYPMIITDALTGSILRIPMFITNSSSATSSGQKGQTIRLGIYTTNNTNSTVLSLWQSTSYTMAVSYSSNVSWMLSLITGIGNTTSYNSLSASSAGLNLSASLHGQRDILVPVTQSFSSGTYWFGFHHSTSGAGTPGNVLNVSQAIRTWATFNGIGLSTTVSGSGLLQDFGIGSYSTTTGAIPNGISATQINQSGFTPIFYIGNETV